MSLVGVTVLEVRLTVGEPLSTADAKRLADAADAKRLAEAPETVDSVDSAKICSGTDCSGNCKKRGSQG